MIVAVASAALVAGAGQQAASGAESGKVTAVVGSAYGYRSDISVSGGPSTVMGPAGTTGCEVGGSTACSPSAVVPATGGRQSSDDRDGITARYASALAFETSSMAASAQGRTGTAGQVTAAASAGGAELGPLIAGEIASTCTASASGTTASTAITGGQVVTKTHFGTGDPVSTTAIDAAPAANTVHWGTIDHVGDHFKLVLNEQIVAPDGSTTVNALHMYLLGPTAVGEVIVGQSRCGVTSTASRPTTPSAGSASSAAGPPTSSAAGATSSAAGATSSAGRTAAASSPVPRTAGLPGAPVPAAPPTSGPGAFGYYSEVGLFGGPKNPIGPSPTVTLPAGGSATPVTDTAATGDARYGPGIIFTSGPITVSTSGTTQSVTSKVDIQRTNTSGQEVFTASAVSSTCTGSSGSTTLGGATLRISEGDPDVEGDDTTIPIPATPGPNTTHEGKIEGVGDTFRAVFNEQDTSGDGITVNAFHMYLLGPTAVGELIVGQSRCTGTAASTGTRNTTTTTAPPSGNRPGSSAGRSGPGAVAKTGFGLFGPLVFALMLLALGSAALAGGARLRTMPRAMRPLDDGN